MRRILITLSILLLAAIPATALETHVGTVVSADDSSVVLSTSHGESTILWTDVESRRIDLEEGDAVVVRYEDDSPSDLLLIDESVEVEESTPETFHAIAGTVEQTSPENLTLKTLNGTEAFVVYPDELYPPFPEEGSRVAIIYRDTGVNDGYGRYAASEIIELDDSFPLGSGNVEVSYEDIDADTEVQIADADTDVADTTVTVETETEVRIEDESDSYDVYVDEERTLPQTASSVPMIGLLGLLAAFGWIALAIRR